MRKHHASALVTVIGAAFVAAGAHAQPDEAFEQRPGSNAVEQPLPADETPTDELRVLRGARDALIEARDFDAARRPAEDIVADSDAANYEDYARLGRIQA